MAKKVVKWDIELDDSIEAIGLIVGEKQPAIEIPAKFAQDNGNKVEGDLELLYLQYMAWKQGEDYTFGVEEAVFDSLRRNRIIVGPALIPNKLILRNSPEGDFWGYFTEEAVMNASYSFQKHKLIDKFNINHQQGEFVEGAFSAETWIVEDPEMDQSRIFGYNLPKGSWFMKLKIENEELYEQLVGGGEMGLNGFSIETTLLERVIFSKQG